MDVGSSSVRASLYDRTANAIPDTETRVSYSFTHGADGEATIAPDALLESVASSIDGALKKAARNGDPAVICVCLSAFWHSLLGLDASGDPTTPVLTWADRRASKAARELKESPTAAGVYERTGCPPHSSYWPAKLLWLQKEHKETFERTARWVSPAEYLYLRFFGGSRVGTSMASATGLFDQNEKVWDARTLSALGLDEDSLSPISDEPMSGLRGEWAERWPALAGVPWLPAVGDGACSNVGSGAVDRSRLALTIGTSGAMRVLWKADGAGVPEGLWLYRADGERFVCGGALSDGGNLISWLRNTLRLPKDPEELLAKMEPDSHGLTFLPLLAGERGPGWSELASGEISGLSLSSEPGHILRAAMEATALRFALIARALDRAFSEEKEVIANGGALLASPEWMRIVSDTLDRPVHITSVDEASSRGAALLALEALGHLNLEEAAPTRPVRTIEPDTKRHEVYLAALERQVELYGKVIPEG